MNKMRRKELNDWIKMAEAWAAEGENIKGRLESICSDEEDYFDNMPENLQGSINGMNSEEAIEKMNEAIGCMDDAIDAANGAASCIEEI